MKTKVLMMAGVLLVSTHGYANDDPVYGTGPTGPSTTPVDACASEEALEIHKGRVQGAQKQSAIMNRELDKTVGNPTIVDEAIRNARTCNDMVRDALSSIFAGTPLGGLSSLLGLDKQACDKLYDLTGVDSTFNPTNLEDLIQKEAENQIRDQMGQQGISGSNQDTIIDAVTPRSSNTYTPGGSGNAIY